MAWWHLYHVTFDSIDDLGATYPVVTDRGPYKAVAIATGVHRANATWSIYEVSVVDAGVIVGGPGGVVELPPVVYDDRMEW